MSLMDLRNIHEYTIKPLLRTITGVADVNSWGGMVQQFGEPAVKAGIRYVFVACERSSSFATVKGRARQTGFHVLQRHRA